MSIDLLSYSRLDTFCTCPRAFWYAYIDGDRGGDNIYSYIGSQVHEIVECMVKGEIDKDEAKERFLDAMSDADVLGYAWMSDKVREKYTDDILHYLESFSMDPYRDPHIEEHFVVDIGGYPVQGYIDCWFEQENGIVIEDFKTSSKYSKADLESHSMQLAVYAMALERSEKYNGKPIFLRFNMLKYAKVGRKLVERCELSTPCASPGFVDVVYNDALKQRLTDWVTDTMHTIESLDPELYYRWPKGKTPSRDFFCRNICSHFERCSSIAG